MSSRNPVQIIEQITNSLDRCCLFHNTDIQNVHSIAYFDAMFSCYTVDPNLSAQRRTTSVQTTYQGKVYIANDQLRIDDRMMATGVSKRVFRTHLDQHVFFWPTHSECKKMYNSYVRRQPTNKRAIFQFYATPLLLNNFSKVKLCKYNSGSNPLNVSACSYKKGPDIILPAASFESVIRADIPTKPSEIREIMVEDRVEDLTQYIFKIYSHNQNDLPEKWRHFYEPITNF